MRSDNYIRNIKKMKSYLNHYMKRHSCQFGTPLIMSFLVTNRCNLSCKHCFYHETIDNGAKKAELTIDEFNKISKSMDNFLTGIFCGGEPFVRDDFFEIINIFQKNNNLALADSASNGQLTDRILRQVEKILVTSPNQRYSLGISIDGFKEQHDEIRGTDTFEKALMTYRELQKLGKYHSNFELYICTTINKINEYSLEAFLKFAIAELKPSKISLIKTRQQPRVGNVIKEINMSNYLSCIEILERSSSYLDSGQLEKPQSYLLQSVNNYIYDGEIKKRKQFHCYAGLHGGFIDYNGDVGVCEVLYKIGNLREYGFDFKKLWNNSASHERRSQINNLVECECCTHESEGLLPSLYFEPNEIKYERKCKLISNESNSVIS